MNEIAPASASGCPHHSSADFKPYFDDEFYAAFAAARAAEPVFYAPEIDCWIVTKYHDVLAVLLDPEHYSAVNASSGVTPLAESTLKILAEGGFTPETTMANLDPPVHTRVRTAATPLLNLRVAAKLEAQIRATVQKYLDRLAGKTRVDLVQALTYELPAYVIFLLLGISEKDTEFVKENAMGRTQLSFCPSTEPQQIDGAHKLVKLWNYTVGLVQDRLVNPGDDFISGLLDIRNGNDDILTLNDVNTISYSIVFAGHETTTNQLTNTFRDILADRDAWETLCAEPGLAANVVEEGLRMSGAVIGWRRRTKAAVELGGVTLPAHANVMLSFASANRDPEVFDNPDKFDPRRKNARKHLTLGSGIHHCLGAALARREMQIVIEEFSKRFPGARLVTDQTYSYLHTFVFRAQEALLVDLS